MDKIKIAIRTNGGGEGIGFGHLMRCLSLADELTKQGAQVYFISKDYKPGIDLLKSRGYEVKTIDVNAFGDDDLKQSTPLLENADLIITDSYEIGTGYLQGLKQLNIPVGSFDDLYGNSNLTTIPSELVINPNPYAEKEHYKDRVAKSAILLLGNKYTSLREEFAKAAQEKRILRKNVRTIIVSMGGEDKDNNTKKVIKTIENIPNNLEVTVVLGAANTHKEEIGRYIKGLKHKYKIRQNVQNISEYMLKADIAITAGGTTVWEFCACGTPFIVLTCADNQEGVAGYVQKTKIGVSIGYPAEQGLKRLSESINKLIKDFALRQELSKNAKKLIDGKGAQRLAKEIIKYVKK